MNVLILDATGPDAVPDRGVAATPVEAETCLALPGRLTRSECI